MDNSDNCTKIVKKLRLLGSKYSIWSVFEDWLAVCAISISNSVDWNHREEREAQYLKTINKYSSDEQEILAEAFSELIIALQKEYDINGPTDLLGKIFHAFELHNKYQGQFFTPFNVCKLMGEISAGNIDNSVDEALSKKGYLTVYEPCVGSGGLVLGFVNAMYRKKNLIIVNRLRLIVVILTSNAYIWPIFSCLCMAFPLLWFTEIASLLRNGLNGILRYTYWPDGLSEKKKQVMTYTTDSIKIQTMFENILKGN